ncbi:hypothetical protein BDV96DRAFT_680016 [Lophiotrema nucula]|uniref:DUF3533 domain-containing protein n=1 Tax=Lophiotrema nucula TaxID=690887 RepID=A0A6A5ZF08_9PLEO|nr:hypothetical protein BDV96DRAFT_680016 [Lophiotrema nucula]
MSPTEEDSKTETNIQHEPHPHTPDSSSSPAPQSEPLYAHGFFSKHGRAARKALIPGLLFPLIYNAILLWACCALVFGSLLKSNELGKIKVAAVDLDGGFVGAGVIDGIKRSLEGGGRGLRWSFVDGGGVGGEMGGGLVLGEKVWAVLEVSANASSNLNAALVNGDAAYDPLSAVSLYFTSARNQVTTLAVAVPAIMGSVNPILGQIAVKNTATFLGANANDTEALERGLKCPQCLASPFVVKSVDLIPFKPPAVFGILNTGLIFLLVFTFQIFTILRAGAETFGHLFTLPTQLYIRTFSSLACYFFLSLMYTLVTLAFSIPLTGHYPTSSGSGFMTLWMLNWCTMGACGLIMEAADTLIGMFWAPFFLNMWLIINASGAFASFEVMPGFYQYGYAVPFYHTIQATRTIVLGTKSHLGLNFGVLIVWMVVGLGGVYLATAWRMRESLRTGVHRVL